MDFNRLSGPDYAKVLKKLSGKDAINLVCTNKYMYEKAIYWQGSIQYRIKRLLVYCDAERVVFQSQATSATYKIDPKEEAHFYVEELTIGIASSDANLLFLAHRLPKNLKCRRLIVRSYHLCIPFLFHNFDMSYLFAHFGARDLQLHMINVSDEFSIKPTVCHLSYFVTNPNEVAYFIGKIPFAPYLYLDFGGLSMSQILQSVVTLWLNGRLPLQKWIRLRLFRDRSLDLDAEVILQECLDFLNHFNQHSLYPNKLSIEGKVPIEAIYRIQIPREDGKVGMILFSEPNKTPTLMGRRESICDFFPSYQDDNDYDPKVLLYPFETD